jgi:hypothetical protein
VHAVEEDGRDVLQHAASLPHGWQEIEVSRQSCHCRSGPSGATVVA